jgi:ligand-binding sensor domain-containing protein
MTCTLIRGNNIPIKRINVLLVIAFLLIVIYNDSCQSQNLSFNHYSVEDGLPGATVNDLVLDSQGYLWMGVWGGVARFDGMEFKVFKNGSEYLGGTAVLSVFEDSRKRLWFGTFGGGVSCLEDDNWVKFGSEEGFSGKIINGIAEDTEGGFWFATQQSGAIRLHDEKWSTVSVEQGLPFPHTTDVLCLNNGDVWIACYRGGIVRLAADGSMDTVSEIEGRKLDRQYCLYQDNDGDLWLGTNKGVARLSHGQWVWVEGSGMGPEIRVNDIFQDRQGNYWFSTTEKVLKLDVEGNWSSIDNSNGLFGRRIQVVREDFEGNIWIGTNTGGLFKLRPSPFFGYTFIKEETPGRNTVKDISELPDGTLVFATKGMGLRLLREGRWSNYTTSDGLGSDNLISLLCASDGRIWAGSQSAGVSLFSDGKWEVLGGDNPLKDNPVNCIYEDREGKVWFGTASAVNCFDGKVWIDVPQDRAWFNKADAYDILQDNDGNIWYCLYGLGAVRTDGKTYEVFDESNGFCNYPLSICTDNDGNLWFAAERSGIYSYDGRAFTNFNKKDGLPGDYANEIIFDGKDVLIGTDVGLVRFNGSSFSLYSKYKGISGSVTNHGLYLDSKDCLWVGSSNGVYRYDKKLDKPILIHPRVGEISASTLDGFPVKSGARLAHSVDGILFSYNGITYTAPDQLEYHFILVGQDRQWSNTKARSIRYTNLDPGDYTFRLKVLNGDGTWSKDTAAFSFSVASPFWKTYWFMALELAVLLGIIYGLFYMRHKRRINKEIVRKNEQLALALKENEEKNIQLQKALDEVHTLRGIIPICSSCKKIRDDQGLWNQVEEYIRQHSEAEFSHGICPDCMKRLYPEMFEQ